MPHLQISGEKAELGSVQSKRRFPHSSLFTSLFHSPAHTDTTPSHSVRSQRTTLAMNLFSTQVPLSLIASLTLYPLLFAGLRRQQWVRRILPPKADSEKHYHLCNKMVASTHSTIMTLTGTYLLMSVDWTKNDISTYKSSLTPFLVGLELGYLTQDTGFEFYQRAVFGVGSNLILFHHVVVILGAVYYLYALTLTSPGPYFIGMLSIMNLSTPILHLRWALQSRGRTFFNSSLKRVVDTALLASYFWCRIVGNWWMCVVIGTKWGFAWYEAPWHIGKRFTITFTTMFIVNFIWWLILTKQWIGSAKALHLGKIPPPRQTTTSSRTGTRLLAKKVQ